MIIIQTQANIHTNKVRKSIISFIDMKQECDYVCKYQTSHFTLEIIEVFIAQICEENWHIRHLYKLPFIHR